MHQWHQCEHFPQQERSKRQVLAYAKFVNVFFLAVTEPWHGKLYEEHYLPANLCQSRLDGRNGSNACTVIATQVATKVLQGLLPLPDPGEALQQKK